MPFITKQYTFSAAHRYWNNQWSKTKNKEVFGDDVRIHGHNYDLLKEVGKSGGYKAQAELIVKSLEHFFSYDGFKEQVRIHESGDFYNGEYLKAWIEVARMMPKNKFYAYTKSLRYWIANMDFVDHLPNFVLTASYGGREDNLIDEHGLRSTTVIFSEEQAWKLGLSIDHDDSHAADPAMKNQDFALLIHGTQPKGSAASVALQTLKRKAKHE